MRIFSFISIFLVIVAIPGFSQHESAPKPTINRPIYFDVSPPLRDMAGNASLKYDHTWKDGIIRNFIQDPDETPLDMKFSDPVVQHLPGSVLVDTTIVNFDAQGNTGGFVPPDTHGDIGPNYYFQVVNCSYAIYNKSGIKILGSLPNSFIWNGLPNNSNDGDAVVLYDEQADRWMFTQFSLPNYPLGPFFQMIAVSQTPDPTGPWYRWEYQFAEMPDYPKFGVWPDGYYMSCNRFSSGKLGYTGVGASAFDRNAMLAGDPDAAQIYFNFSPGTEGFITMMPSDCDGSFPEGNPPNYFTYIRGNGSQHLGIYEFHADWVTPANSTFGNSLILPVTSYSTVSGGIPQLGTTRKLDHLSDRLMYRQQYRKFSDHQSMVLNHTVNAGSNIAGIRWYELRNTGSGWSIYQQSTFGPSDGNHRWMASIAQDTAGTIAMGYSVSSTSMYPALRYTGRFKTDPLNQMTVTEKSIIEGGGCQTGGNNPGGNTGRWGDYSACSVDPENPTTFWFTSEYYQTTSGSNWQTRIAAFSFNNTFAISASASPALYCFPDSARLDVLSYGNSSSLVYSWTSIPPGFTSNLKNPVVYPVTTTRYAVTVINGTEVKHDTTQVNVVYPATAFSGNDTTICSDATSLQLNGQATNYNFIGWGSDGDGYFTNSSSLDATYVPGPGDIAAGGVNLVLIAFPLSPCQGNATDIMHVIIDPCSGIPGRSNNGFSISLSPNPASGKVRINFTGLGDQPSKLTISDIVGTQVWSMNIDHQKDFSTDVDLSGIAGGIYLVTVVSSDVIHTRKLIIR